MKTKMIGIAVFSAVAMMINIAICASDLDVGDKSLNMMVINTAETLAITFGTIFYHFAMRLFVGLYFDRCYDNKMNYNRKWFKSRSFEAELFKKLKVKSWKKHLPTYDPATFDVESCTTEELIGATCQAEAVHEVIMVLSFVPILGAKWFGALPVFVITSVCACLFDSAFVIMQRYNRPRLIKLAEREARKRD